MGEDRLRLAVWIGLALAALAAPASCGLTETAPTGPSGSGGAASTSSSSERGASSTGTLGTGGGAGGTSSQGGGGSSCAGQSTCAPALGGGDVVVVADGDHPCPAGYAQAQAWGDGADPGCDCHCDPNVGGQCTPGTESGYRDPTCTSYIGAVDLPDMGCFALPGNPGDVEGHILLPSHPTPGGCNQTAPASPAPLATKTVCTLAGAPGDPCDGGACVPNPGAPFDAVCDLLPAGQTQCPAGWASVAMIQSFDGDTRQCACTCSPQDPATCVGAELELYNGTTCTGAVVATFPADGTCKDASAATMHQSERVVAGTWTPGTCQGQQSESGAITWGAPRKLCCLP